jgi:PKD repeat protein
MSKKLTYPGNNRRIKQKASLLTLMLLLMVGGILLAAPLLTSTTMAQQTTTTATTAPETTTTAPLTPEELTEQSRLQNVTSAITRNLQQGEMRINGIVYTPRWSDPVWVQPNSLSVLFVYCLPGEYASSGQQILGSRDLNVLESYSLALSPVLTGWLMIVENEHQAERNPAAVGVICASDANDPQTRILSPQEQIVINNVVKQFITIRNTVINNITQIINIINNVTRPPPTNDTGGNTTDPLTVQAVIADIDQDATPVVLFETLTDGGTPPYTCLWDLGDGTTSDTCSVSHTYANPGTYTAVVTVTDATGQTASDDTGPFNITNTGGGNTTDPLTVQAEIDIDQDATPVVGFETLIEGGTPPYTCLWDLGDGTTSDTCSVSHTYPIPGTYTAVVTVTDATGQTASDSIGPFTITHPETTEEDGEGGAVAEEPPAGTTTEGEDTTTTTTTTMPSTTTMDSAGQ